MRGPNKIKRKIANDSKSSRRASIASVESSTSVSTSSDDPQDSIRKLSLSPSMSVEPGHGQFTMSFDATTPSKSTASPNLSPLSGSPSMGPQQISQQPKHRPSHIDLSGTKLYEHMPASFVPLTAFEFGPDVSPSGSNAWRRASLPSYLLESFTNQYINRSPSLGSIYTPPRGIDVVDTTLTR